VSWLTTSTRPAASTGLASRCDRLHTDSPYEDEPPRLASCMQEVPSSKGGTIFATCRRLRRALRRDERKARRHGRAPRSPRWTPGSGLRGRPRAADRRAYPEKARPAVATHPVSGRQSSSSIRCTRTASGNARDRRTLIDRSRHSTQTGSPTTTSGGRRRVDVGRDGNDAPRWRRYRPLSVRVLRAPSCTRARSR